MKVKTYKLVTDINAFEERVPEILADASMSDIRSTVAKLKDALYDNPDIACLCAPQIGSNLRLFAVKTAKTSENRFKVFLNPMVVNHEKEVHLSRETNASFPNKEFIIPRFDKVHVAYQEIDGRVNSETYFGTYGEVVQQMIEMLDGITLVENGLDLDDVGGVKAFDKAPKKQQKEVIEMYLDNLKKKSDALQEEINNNEDLSNMNKQIDLMTGLINGTIKPVDKDGKEVDWKPVENNEK